MRVGDIAVTPLSDGHFDLPLAAFHAPPGAPTLQGPSQRIGAHAWLIESGHRRILVDTGSGQTLRDRFPRTGQLPAALAALGHAPDSITDIVITHMHPDHIGGLMAGDTPRYPNAMLHVCQAEWFFWTDPGAAASLPKAMRPMAGAIAALADGLRYHIAMHPVGSSIGGGVRLEPAPGHTPGHQIVHVASGNDQLVLLGDALISGTLQFTRPDIRYTLDVDQDRAAATRSRLFDRIAADRMRFAATHLPLGGAYTLARRKDAGYRATPQIA